MKLHGLVVTALLVGAVTAQAQQQSPPDGLTPQFTAERGSLVEILGLRSWTAAMIRDSIAERAPDVSPTTFRVVDALKDVFRFPEALMWTQTGDSAWNGLLVVIEPRDSARLHRRVFVGDTTRRLAPWSPLGDFAAARFDLVTIGLEPLIALRVAGLPIDMPIQLRFDSVEVRRFWAMLDARRTAADRDTARALLRAAPNVNDRVTALAVLANFSGDDVAWHALVGALLDPAEPVRELALRVLDAFVHHATRTVDWAPAAHELHAILDGAVPWCMQGVADVLVATRVSRELAGPLLGGGGYGVLMFAGAAAAKTRLPSYRLLRALSGDMSRTQPVEWRAWVSGLGQ